MNDFYQMFCSSLGNDFTIRDIESDGNKTTRSLSGLKRDASIMYVEAGPFTTSVDRLSHAMSEPELYIDDEEEHKR